MKKTTLLLVVIIIAIVIVGLLIIRMNSKDKRIELTDENKIEINDQLSEITTIDCFDTLDLSKEGNIIETDKGKYEFIILMMTQKFDEENLIFVNNGYFNEGYLEISKFQTYAQKFYNQEININNIKDCIYIKDNTIYVKVSIDGLGMGYAVKADYITENKKEGNKSLYVNIISLNDENVKLEEQEKYISKDFLDYDESKVTYTLKITYAVNEKTQENYIISIERI